MTNWWLLMMKVLEAVEHIFDLKYACGLLAASPTHPVAEHHLQAKYAPGFPIFRMPGTPVHSRLAPKTELSKPSGS